VTFSLKINSIAKYIKPEINMPIPTRKKINEAFLILSSISSGETVESNELMTSPRMKTKAGIPSPVKNAATHPIFL
jgi:hypothetical protein